MTMKKLIKSTTTQVVDFRTGEAIESTTSQVYQIPSEPPYVKLYLDDLCELVKVGDPVKALLLRLLHRLDFEGFIILSPRSRKQIAESIGISDQTFRNRLSELCKTDLIRRVSLNEFQVNPLYFARGDWRKICMNRQAFQLRITYSPKSGRKIETVTTPEPDAPIQDELEF